MVKGSDEYLDDDDASEEEFDIEEFLSLVDEELTVLVETLGIDAIWLTQHSTGGICIHYDTPPISNTEAPEDVLDARTAYWQGVIGTDYEDVESVAQSMFEMLKAGLSKEP